MVIHHQRGNLRRRGNVAPLVALCLIPIIGIAALVMDIGLARDQRRQAVSAADAAALAGATDLYTNYSSHHGVDDNNSAVTSAQTTAAANGFPTNGANCSVTVNVYPGNYQGGAFAGTQIPRGYVEVIINFSENPLFSNIWGSSQLTGQARAVARGTYRRAAPGILVLDPSGNNSLNVTGSGNVAVMNGGSVVVNSNSPNGGATLTGSGNVIANVINLGDSAYNQSGAGSLVGTINYNVPAAPDPLAALPEPSVPSYPTLPAATLNAQGMNYSTSNGVVYSGSANIDLYPGYYAGIQITGSGSATLHPNTDGSPGVYYISSQGFSMTSSGGITGNNVLVYSDGTGNINLTGSGNLTLSPPTSGTYVGLAIFQERSSNKQISVTAQGNMDVTGTLYAANAKVMLTAQGSYNNSFGSQWIFYDLGISGSGNFTVDYTRSATPVRSIQLVE